MGGGMKGFGQVGGRKGTVLVEGRGRVKRMETSDG